MILKSINPATEELIATYDEFSPEQLDAALGDAHRAFAEWRYTSFAERARLMRAAAGTLRGEQARLAALVTAEMGKPIVEAEAEIEKCAWNCEYYADNAERFLAEETIPTNARLSYVEFDPLGPVLAIMPWNFPFWQVIRFAAPALVAGNVCVLKHASNVPQCALALEQLFTDAGAPEGVFQTLLIDSKTVGDVIGDRRIAAV